jgi:hypothetical protein
MGASKIKMGQFRAFTKEGRQFRFNPVGDVHEVGDASSWFTRNYKSNPWKEKEEESQGARIIVGFNVGIEEKFDMEYIIDLVFKIRRKQVEDAIKDGDAEPHPYGGDVGITFLAQQGIWQSVRDDRPYPERGAQVIVMNIINEKKNRFKQDMIDIAEEMVSKMKQNMVLIEMSKNGAVTATIEVFP